MYADAARLFDNLQFWGGFVLALGMIAIVATIAVRTGSDLAYWLAIVLVGLSAVSQLMFVHADPSLTAVVVGLDIFVAWALVARWGDRLRID